jgi:hypothetical protein
MYSAGDAMSDTPRTDVAQHNMGSVVEPHYVVDVEVAHDLERELVEARKDAERYRYVRSVWGLPDENFNALIDAAMKESGK